jgi:hypothetical protein
MPGPDRWPQLVVGSRWRHRRSGRVATVVRLYPSASVHGGVGLRYAAASSEQVCHPDFFLEHYELIEGSS